MDRFKYEEMSGTEKIEFLERQLSRCYECKYEGDKIYLLTEYFEPTGFEERRRLTLKAIERLK